MVPLIRPSSLARDLLLSSIHSDHQVTDPCRGCNKGCPAPQAGDWWLREKASIPQVRTSHGGNPQQLLLNGQGRLLPWVTTLNCPPAPTHGQLPVLCLSSSSWPIFSHCPWLHIHPSSQTLQTSSKRTPLICTWVTSAPPSHYKKTLHLECSLHEPRRAGHPTQTWIFNYRLKTSFLFLSKEPHRNFIDSWPRCRRPEGSVLKQPCQTISQRLFLLMIQPPPTSFLFRKYKSFISTWEEKGVQLPCRRNPHMWCQTWSLATLRLYFKCLSVSQKEKFMEGGGWHGKSFSMQ